MIPDGSYRAVVDRFEDSNAALELSGAETRYELVVGKYELPRSARHTDAILEVEVVDGELVDVDYKPEASTEQAEAAQDRFDRLSKRPPDDDSS